MKKLYIITVFVIVPLYGSDNENDSPGNSNQAGVRGSRLSWLNRSKSADSSLAISSSSSSSPDSQPNFSPDSASDSEDQARARSQFVQSLVGQSCNREKLYEVLGLDGFKGIQEGGTLGDMFKVLHDENVAVRELCDQLNEQIQSLSKDVLESKKQNEGLSVRLAVCEGENKWLTARIALCEALLSSSNEQNNNEGNALNHSY